MATDDIKIVYKAQTENALTLEASKKANSQNNSTQKNEPVNQQASSQQQSNVTNTSQQAPLNIYTLKPKVANSRSNANVSVASEQNYVNNVYVSPNLKKPGAYKIQGTNDTVFVNNIDTSELGDINPVNGRLVIPAQTIISNTPGNEFANTVEIPAKNFTNVKLLGELGDGSVVYSANPSTSDFKYTGDSPVYLIKGRDGNFTYVHSMNRSSDITKDLTKISNSIDSTISEKESESDYKNLHTLFNRQLNPKDAFLGIEASLYPDVIDKQPYNVEKADPFTKDIYNMIESDDPNTFTVLDAFARDLKVPNFAALTSEDMRTFPEVLKAAGYGSSSLDGIVNNPEAKKLHVDNIAAQADFAANAYINGYTDNPYKTIGGKVFDLRKESDIKAFKEAFVKEHTKYIDNLSLLGENDQITFNSSFDDVLNRQNKISSGYGLNSHALNGYKQRVNNFYNQAGDLLSNERYDSVQEYSSALTQAGSIALSSNNYKQELALPLLNERPDFVQRINDKIVTLIAPNLLTCAFDPTTSGSPAACIASLYATVARDLLGEFGIEPNSVQGQQFLTEFADYVNAASQIASVEHMNYFWSRNPDELYRGLTQNNGDFILGTSDTFVVAPGMFNVNGEMSVVSASEVNSIFNKLLGLDGSSVGSVYVNDPTVQGGRDFIIEQTMEQLSQYDGYSKLTYGGVQVTPEHIIDGMDINGNHVSGVKIRAELVSQNLNVAGISKVNFDDPTSTITLRNGSTAQLSEIIDVSPNGRYSDKDIQVDTTTIANNIVDNSYANLFTCNYNSVSLATTPDALLSDQFSFDIASCGSTSGYQRHKLYDSTNGSDRNSAFYQRALDIEKNSNKLQNNQPNELPANSVLQLGQLIMKNRYSNSSNGFFEDESFKSMLSNPNSSLAATGFTLQNAIEIDKLASSPNPTIDAKMKRIASSSKDPAVRAFINDANNYPLIKSFFVAGTLHTQFEFDNNVAKYNHDIKDLRDRVISSITPQNIESAIQHLQQVQPAGDIFYQGINDGVFKTNKLKLATGEKEVSNVAIAYMKYKDNQFLSEFQTNHNLLSDKAEGLSPNINDIKRSQYYASMRANKDIMYNDVSDLVLKKIFLRNPQYESVFGGVNKNPASKPEDTQYARQISLVSKTGDNTFRIGGGLSYSTLTAANSLKVAADIQNSSYYDTLNRQGKFSDRAKQRTFKTDKNGNPLPSELFAPSNSFGGLILSDEIDARNAQSQLRAEEAKQILKQNSKK